ncbi:unnamed protein product [Chrysodeixis includens]|uniref:Uncharacterized protein n=1 Tax=Chrysodeixis includens TaxID=689277 RepID=A0A9P0C507_CHRIL|nr:unnamed protein product [Chrysodeixis includens]
MKCASSSSVDSFMSSQRCSLKLRFLALVINTGDLINERATHTFTVSHALIAPAALITTYVMIGTFVICGMKGNYATKFLQVYGLVTCCALQGALALLVFRELSQYTVTTETVLNGLLPMLTILLLLSDLVVVMFSSRNLPEPPRDSIDSSIMDMHT